MDHEFKAFEFLKYNIDYMNLKTAPGLVLSDNDRITKDFAWATDIVIRDAEFMATSRRYIGGLELRLRLLPKEGTVLDGLVGLREEPLRSGSVLCVEMGIRGVYQLQGERYPSEVEEHLTSCHMPGTLFPYARSALTSLLASGGYPHFVMPLVNMWGLAKERGPVEVTEVEG